MRFQIVVLALVVVGAIAADSDFDWEELDSDTLNVEPFGCDTAEFRVESRSGYRVSLEPVDFPKGCSLQDDIRATTKVYYRGECLGFDTNLKCAEPTKSGIKNAGQMCENWSDLDSSPFSLDSGESTSIVTGALCFSDEWYYMSVKSSCAKAVKFKVQVDSRELTDREDVACDWVENFFDESTKIAVGVLVLLIVVPTLIIAGSVTACCCFCAGCPCYYKRNRTPALVHTYAAHPGSQGIPENGAPALLAMGSVKKETF